MGALASFFYILAASGIVYCVAISISTVSVGLTLGCLLLGVIARQTAEDVYVVFISRTEEAARLVRLAKLYEGDRD